MPKRQYSLAEVESCLQRKSWWAILFILPCARRISFYIINRTDIRPNTVTIGSFVFVLGAAYCYTQGTKGYLLFGALLFELNYLCDCIDGTIARVKGLASPLGAYLDPKLDRLRVVLLSFALAWGQFRVDADVDVVLALLLYLGTNNLIMLTRATQERVLVAHGFSSRLGADLVAGTSPGQGWLSRWLSASQKRNLMPYYHDVELDALVFVLGPALTCVFPFTVVAIIFGFILIFFLDVLFIRSLFHSTGSR